MEISPNIFHKNPREAAKIYQTDIFAWKNPFEPKRCIRKNSRKLATHLWYQQPTSLAPTSRCFGDSNCQKSQNHLGIVVSATFIITIFLRLTRQFSKIAACLVAPFVSTTFMKNRSNITNNLYRHCEPHFLPRIYPNLNGPIEFRPGDPCHRKEHWRGRIPFWAHLRRWSAN